MEQYMSVGDAAKALGVVPATVKLMLRNGRLTPVARTVGGIYLFAPTEVERLAADRLARDEHRDKLSNELVDQEALNDA